MISRRGLTREQECTWRNLKVRILPHPVVKDDDTQCVEQLPLVFVDALDLAIKDCVRIYRFSGLRFEPVGKSDLRLASGFAKTVAKHFVFGEWLQLAQVTEVRDPAVTYGVADRPSQRGVCKQQPTSGRDPIGLIVEALGKHLGQIFDRRRA